MKGNKKIKSNVGIWNSKNRKVAGGAFTPETKQGEIAKANITRLSEACQAIRFEIQNDIISEELQKKHKY